MLSYWMSEIDMCVLGHELNSMFSWWSLFNLVMHWPSVHWIVFIWWQEGNEGIVNDWWGCINDDIVLHGLCTATGLGVAGKGELAQLAERSLCMRKVTDSISVFSSLLTFSHVPQSFMTQWPTIGVVATSNIGLFSLLQTFIAIARIAFHSSILK